MDRQQIALALVLQEAGIPLSVDTFDHRMILQKAVCLLQGIGVPLGYHFRWYLYGPYSPELTQDAFAVTSGHARVEQEIQNTKLAEVAATKARRLRELLGGVNLRERAQKLELLASVLFLIRTKQGVPDAPDRIASLLQAYKKPFTTDQVRQGLALLRQHEFPI
jgi:hypothetical protein